MSMDCNKDEAIRAKELSEKKMANNDFEGARNIALKAQKLFPALENITQLLSTCDVHCSAQKRIIGTEKDWYAILQVDRSADDSTIKKQYRRLALILHPDKNRLPGAEAAFKLISEANAILSDSIKKSIYDNKIRVFAPTNPPPHYMNRNFNVNQQSGFRTNITNGFGNLNQHKAEIILTFCPFCKTKYQCHREHVNKSLRCKTCSKPFMACETSGQGVPKSGQPSAQVPLKPGFSQPAVFHEKVVLNQGCSKVGVQNGKGSSVSQENASTKPVQPEPGIKIGSNSEGNPVASAFSGNGDMKDNGTFTNYKKGGNESRDLEKNRKRGRKMVEDSSESDSDPESDSGDDSHGNVYEYPDTEFYDFEKERDGSPFKVGQIWACYDDSDGMPRFYAKVTKASSFPFQVSFRWLEAVPINETDKNLVVGCGTFKLGSKIEKRSERNMFSHQMTNCLPGKKRGSFTIYPKKGEIWALSKKRDPENNKEFKCEIVEVLSDFVDGVGLTVCYMDKVDGFVSVFQKATGSESFMIGEDEQYKFSHRVPSFKLDGSEKDGVPRGSFELDPASLPSNPDDLHFPGKAKKKSGEMDCGVHCSPPKPAEVKNPLKSESKKVFIDLDDE